MDKFTKRIDAFYYRMLRRCHNEENDKYQEVGGRGIKSRFISKDAFREWYINEHERVNGEELSLIRLDKNKDYMPDNMTFVTPDVLRKYFTPRNGVPYGYHIDFTNGIWTITQYTIKGVNTISKGRNFYMSLKRLHASLDKKNADLLLGNLPAIRTKFEVTTFIVKDIKRDLARSTDRERLTVALNAQLLFRPSKTSTLFKKFDAFIQEYEEGGAEGTFLTLENILKDGSIVVSIAVL
jgi:hypothetical protein